MKTSILATVLAFQTMTAAPLGTVNGAVRDRDGMLPGATVTMTRQGVDSVTKLATRPDGTFQFMLPEGVYNLSVSASGFRTATSVVRVEPSKAFTMNFQLQIGSLSEVMNITPDMASAPSAFPKERVTPNPRSVPEMLDVAKWLFDEGRIPEAQAMTTRATELMNTVRPRAATSTAPAGSVGPIRIGGSVLEPRKIRDEAPVYPTDLATAGRGGSVILEGVVGADGTVRNVKVLQGTPLLDAAALAAVQQWRYSPAQLNGAPIEVALRVTMNFRVR